MRELLDLSCDEQEKLLSRLTYHALCKMRRLTWRGATLSCGGSVPRGYEPDDFALDAIGYALEKPESWNRAVYETLESFLRSHIDSRINRLVMSADNRRGRRLSTECGMDNLGDEFSESVVDPVEIATDKDWQTRFQEAAKKELENDEFLTKLLECMEAEITKPQDIAELHGVTVDHVNNEKKRLRRKLNKLNTRNKPRKKGAR